MFDQGEFNLSLSSFIKASSIFDQKDVVRSSFKASSIFDPKDAVQSSIKVNSSLPLVHQGEFLNYLMNSNFGANYDILLEEEGYAFEFGTDYDICII